jgi:hypothetical protein
MKILTKGTAMMGGKQYHNLDVDKRRRKKEKTDEAC